MPLDKSIPRFTLCFVKRAYRYRIYANQQQLAQLHQVFSFCCFLYNSALQERTSYYKKYGKGLFYNTQSAELPPLKEVFDTSHIFAQSLQQVLKRLDFAYKAFFRRVKNGETVGFPRYKSFDRFRSITFPQCDLKTGGVKLLDKKHIKVFGIDNPLRIKMHRPFLGRCKTVSIVKDIDQFFLILSCDDVPQEALASTGKTIAFDLGLNSFITTDDGMQFHHPKPYRTAKEKLAFLNQKLARKQRGSDNRKRAKQELARAHRKVKNVRNDYLHKISKQIISENDTIIFEDLNVKSMMEKEREKGKIQPNKGNISDASWINFTNMLTYKAESAGRKVVKVDPKNTSRMCSCCGNLDTSQTLADRFYYCWMCGEGMDRDLNAAKNIRRIGMILAKDQQDLFQKPQCFILR